MSILCEGVLHYLLIFTVQTTASLFGILDRKDRVGRLGIAQGADISAASYAQSRRGCCTFRRFLAMSMETRDDEQPMPDRW